MTLLQEFSSGYLIAPEVDVVPFSGENAAAPHDLVEEIEEVVGWPIYGAVAGRRFQLRSECGIPADTVAVPKGQFRRYGSVLLIEKPNAEGVFY